jgi:hypothetical protein
MSKLSNKAIIEAVKKHRGNISKVAESLGCSRTAIHDRANKYYTIKKAIDEARDAFDDQVESVHYSAILKEENTAERIFHMKTRMRRRGYAEKVDHGVDGDITIKIQYADD